MLVREDSIPKPNIYSNKLLFDQGDNRNKKRIAQMLRRKTALSSKKEKRDNEKSISPIKSPIIQKINKKEDSVVIDLNKKNYVNNNDIDNTVCEKDVTSENKLENEDMNDIKKHFIHESTIINLDCSPVLSNNAIFNENNYYNNSSTNNSNNNSIINRDSQEKEVNISNLDNESVEDIIINKEDNNPEEECLNINNDNDKFLSKSLYNYDHDDDHILNKEEKKRKEENEFALKYLTSSSDSFVQLDNHLVARAKAQGGEMTESYFQALFPDLMLDSNKQMKNKNYEVTEIIKEEREIDSPFGKTNYFSKNSSKTSRTSLDIGNIKRLKKSLAKTKSNVLLPKKKKNNINNNNNKKNKNNKNDMSSNANNETLKFKKYKSVSNFKNIKKVIINNNNEIKKNKNEQKQTKKLIISSSFLNLKMDKIKSNKNTLKIKSDSQLNLTFSSNLYKKGKNEMKLNKNIRNQNNIKKSFTNLLDIESELNDALLIHNCVKKIGKSKNLKISKHYLKNINFYNRNKESDNKNKIIKKRNQNENSINKLNLDSTILTSSSKINYLNTTDITKKPKYVLKKDISRKNLSKNLKNNIDINSLDKTLNNSNKNYSYKNCVSSFSVNENIKPKKFLTKKDRVKSFSRLILKKNQINDILNTETSIRRAKSNHKKLNTITNTEFINSEASLMKIKTKKNNNNVANNIINQKKKFVPFHKKNDYSYVKAKVQTGLSEEVIKKLLNNNKKIANKEINKKIEQDKKQSLLKKCKNSMNRTIESFKTMASNIKKKLFKKDKNEKQNNNEETHNNNIYSNRNNKKTMDNTFFSFKKKIDN